MSITTTRAPLPILTTLRFFAAAEVVIYHGITPQFTNDFIFGLGSAGYQAVTFFFVLSGFILTYVYTGISGNNCLNVSSREFWRARAARILPAYFLGLLIALPQFTYSALVSKIITIKALIVGLALVPIFQQAWWPPAATAWVTPAWSLSVEFFFYALFPMLTFIAARFSRNYFIFLVYGIVIVIVFLRYLISPQSVAFGSMPWNFVAYFPPFHLPQFIFGMALGRIFIFGPSVPARIHSSMLCMGSVALVFVFGGRSILPAWTQTDAILVLLFGLVIFGGARAGGAFKVLAFPSLILLGEASYSIYILHLPLRFWWGWLTRGLNLPAISSFVVYFLLVIVVSILSYLYIEKPLRRRILGHREHRDA